MHFNKAIIGAATSKNMTMMLTSKMSGGMHKVNKSVPSMHALGVISCSSFVLLVFFILF